MTTDFTVEFWGVRGSIPCAGSDYAIYGGNTSCVLVRVGREILIFDAGTGLRGLGQRLQQEGVKQYTLFLSHTHFDHIAGLPFFAPAYDPSCHLTLYAGHLQQPLKQVLDTVLDAPFFPISPATFKAKMQYVDFNAGDSLSLAPVSVRTTLLSHPDRAIGYRVDYNGKSVCYVTDTEHSDTPDANILGLIQDADLVIYDSMFSGSDYARHKGWGHSSVEEAMKLCRMAGVGRLALFHHNPDYLDTDMARIEQSAQQEWAGVFAAKEGMVVWV